MHFNRFYKNAKKICRVDKFQANYQTITFHDDIFSQTAKAITEVLWRDTLVVCFVSCAVLSSLFSRKNQSIRYFPTKRMAALT